MGLLQKGLDWFSKAKRAPNPEDGAFRLLAESSVDVIFHFGPDLKHRYISPSSEQLLGWTPEEIMATGSKAGDPASLHPDDHLLVAAALERHLSGEIDELMLEFRMIRRDGTPVWVETNCRTVRDANTGRPSDIILTMRDISHKKALEQELSALARKDGLTGLANRRAFDEFMDCEWARSLRNQKQLSLLLVDVDHFKDFNDLNGHQVGDDCLRTIAATLQEVCQRPSDLVARYGGEEFAVVLADTDQEGAEHIARRALVAVHALQLSNPGGGRRRWITVSIGAATAMPTAGGTMKMPEGLLQAADVALYKAKAAGRNRVKTALLLSPAPGAPLEAACG